MSLLIIDISAAYLNTSHKLLLHNLRKRKINHKVIKWVVSFLTNRLTIVKPTKDITSKLSIDLGLSQGSPLSSIFYLFYSADLLEDSAAKRVEAQGFIDNITLIATSKSTRYNTLKLAKVNNQTCEDWRIKQRSEFSLPKYQLIYINKMRDINYIAGVWLRGGHTIYRTTTAINLGITLQSKLS